MKHLLINSIQLYRRSEPLRNQLYISMGISPQACRYSPTCSEYTIVSISNYGTIRGLIMGLKRVASCSPLSVSRHKPTS